MLIDEAKRVVACNQRMLELYDVDPERFSSGLPIVDWVHLGGDLRLMDNWTARERAIAARIALLTGPIDRGSTHHFERKLATGRVLQITRTLLPGGANVVTVSDATERVELRHERLMLETVLQNIVEGVSLIKRDGTLQLFNQSMIDIYGVDPAKVSMGMHVEDFIRAAGDLEDLGPKELEEEVGKRAGLATSLHTGTFKQRRKLRNGRTLQISRTLLEGGSVVATISDITKEVERTRLLAEAKSAAEETSRLKSDFLARVTHELRTPMNGVLGMAALLDRTELDEKQTHFLEVLRRSGQHMVDLIDGLLMVTTQESGGIDLTPSPVCLPTLCEQCLDMVRPRASERGLGLAFLTDAATPLMVMADETRVIQILVNLLNNAVKFTEIGRVELHLTTEHVDGQIRARMQVSDTGVGIAEEKLDEIFQKFAQVGDSLRNQRDGVGLGLSIARSLTEMMGGTLSASSELLQGSIFTLEVDFPEAPPAQASLSA